ncbi:hypothetical protein [Alteriqipengyuania lutimaris]|uniref:hypothetical protein n=1 Tax=Alteriqipengyuania lutimaris TaxID=1538146 RepID=UPI0015F168AE|nr:hypothetical protein [Alteriqipengyuania lutimaris]MBB3035264.1 hypothetical protein [Alteriqipengyuania lutimaris]
MYIGPEKYSLKQLEVLLREYESRTRLIVNLKAVEKRPGETLTLVVQNQDKRARKLLHLRLATDQLTPGSEFDFAGDAFIEGVKTAVCVDRKGI